MEDFTGLAAVCRPHPREAKHKRLPDVKECTHNIQLRDPMLGLELLYGLFHQLQTRLQLRHELSRLLCSSSSWS